MIIPSRKIQNILQINGYWLSVIGTPTINKDINSCSEEAANLPLLGKQFQSLIEICNINFQSRRQLNLIATVRSDSGNFSVSALN